MITLNINKKKNTRFSSPLEKNRDQRSSLAYNPVDVHHYISHTYSNTTLYSIENESAADRSISTLRDSLNSGTRQRSTSIIRGENTGIRRRGPLLQPLRVLSRQTMRVNTASKYRILRDPRSFVPVPRERGCR